MFESSHKPTLYFHKLWTKRGGKGTLSVVTTQEKKTLLLKVRWMHAARQYIVTARHTEENLVCYKEGDV